MPPQHQVEIAHAELALVALDHRPRLEGTQCRDSSVHHSGQILQVRRLDLDLNLCVGTPQCVAHLALRADARVFPSEGEVNWECPSGRQKRSRITQRSPQFEYTAVHAPAHHDRTEPAPRHVLDVERLDLNARLRPARTVSVYQYAVADSERSRLDCGKPGRDSSIRRFGRCFLFVEIPVCSALGVGFEQDIGLHSDKTPDQWLTERLESALYLGLVANPLAIRLAAGQITPTIENRYTLPLYIRVPVERLTFSTPDGQPMSQLKIKVMGLNTSSRSLVMTDRSMSLPRPDGKSGKILDLGVDIELEGGVQVVAIAVRDEASGEASFVSTTMRIGPSES